MESVISRLDSNYKYNHINKGIHVIRHLSIVILGCLCAQAAETLPLAPSLTTANTASPRLESFRANALTNRSGMISFGDSMADQYRSCGYWFTEWLSHSRGIAGSALNNYKNESMIYGIGDIAIVNVLTNTILRKYWFNDFVRVSPGARLWWEKQYSPQGVYCDRQGFFYVKHPGGGLFRVLVSTNNGPWTEAFQLDGYSSDPEGEGDFVEIVFPSLGYYKVGMESLASVQATNFVLGRYYEDSGSSGVVPVFLDRGGIALDTVTNVSLAIREPVFRELYRLCGSNALMLWHMKEPVDATLAPRMLECATVWSNTMPDMAIAYIGTPITLLDSNFLSSDTITVQHNALIRDVAIESDQTYVDCLNPSVSMDWLATSGFIEGDLVHETWLGNQYFGSIIWNDLFDIYRDLSVETEPGQMTVSYERSHWGKYLLQSSTNIVDWSDLDLSSGVATIFTTNIPTSKPAEYFRLQSGPP